MSQQAHPAKSIEGYIIIVTGLHPETSEEQLEDLFADFGPVRNLHLNLDRRTGYVKGYALIEFAELGQAEEVVRQKSLMLLDRKLEVDFAFLEPPARPRRSSLNSRSRSPSPRPSRHDHDIAMEES
ncbi:exon junction complex subunit, RNA-binding protein Rbm8 [Schizosaccharomyces osmophilus]|uniref:Exon junction complex subunit, RNA-binding protein Rbm8 n=1 Tax=Schizosaccharomyces osmophilus TaxID=2545709 RepID=A0AAE9WJR9_9SCHI|nr:exon junction complex subunit, RNA-binding protein Rbm8 [Schizosaccharomyces osmophilus]WBW75546.1 exon junction complex subunit, RNA-binding protein Rbm8 [Schizosaccharomyces osmophilus]